MSLLDGTASAITATRRTVDERGLGARVEDAVVCNIEDLDLKYSGYDAVVGTYVFSFIEPAKFVPVMQNNVLARVVPGGYFVGGFFGEAHDWSGDPRLTMQTPETLHTLLRNNSFSVVSMQEEKEQVGTVNSGGVFFHTIDVIAQRAEVGTSSLPG